MPSDPRAVCHTNSQGEVADGACYQGCAGKKNLLEHRVARRRAGRPRKMRLCRLFAAVLAIAQASVVEKDPRSAKRARDPRRRGRPARQRGAAPPRLGDSALSELGRDDVRRYFATLPDVVPHCAGLGPGLEECVYVSPDGALVHAYDSRIGKQMMMDMMLRGVLADVLAAHGPHDRWLSFSMAYAADGPDKRARLRPFPVLGFGKIHPTRQPGLLIPNPFFASPAWWEGFSNRSLARAAGHPWRERAPSALFRGACGPGAIDRLRLLRLRDEDARLDVGFTKADGYASLPECLSVLAKAHGVKASDVRFVLQNRVRAHVPQTNYSRFRYLLHMPGSATGSYSRNLQYLWTHGAVVLIWRQSAIEWYYPFLRSGEHFLPVDETDLMQTIERVEQDARLRQKLIDGARAFYREHLSRGALVQRWWGVLEVLRRRQQREPPRISSTTACTCDAGLLGRKAYKECSKCEITRKRGAEIGKFIGLGE